MEAVLKEHIGGEMRMRQESFESDDVFKGKTEGL